MRTLALLFSALTIVSAQTVTTFEVASVRPSPVGRGRGGQARGGPGTNDPERLTYERVLFRQLLMDAYGIRGDQIKGPVWATADIPGGGAVFDISAKLPPGATREQAAIMLQNLLKERFQLTVHRATGGPPGLALVVAKGGSKLKASAGPVAESEQGTIGDDRRVKTQLEKDGFPQLFPEHNMGGAFDNGRVRMRFRDYAPSELARQLSFMLGARISDKTGLSGKFDFKLEFTLDEGFLAGMKATLPVSPNFQIRDNQGPNPGQQDAVPVISSAMEKQLGLKLEAAKIAVDTLVIDHAERTPTEN
jgi:uncharacterized protein (TIGR03435 family)